MSNKPYDTPTRTRAIDGEVALNGPDGVGLSMTPEAARKTGERLIRAAGQAARQARKKKPNSKDNQDRTS
jgi:hypothetical protein